MPVLAAQSEAAIAVRTDLCAIFVSLELSRSTWLITSLSPGGGEKMSKYSVPAGDIDGLFRRFGHLQERARVRTGQSFAVVTIQEAGLDGFWIHRVLQREGIESWVVDPASILTSRRRRRAKTDRIDGETLVRTLLAHKRGEPRVCAMVQAPTPEDEDRRRLCRERKVLTAERISHVNRIKGLLFAQGIRDHPSNNLAKLPFDLSVRVPRTRLRPRYGDGFDGAPLTMRRPRGEGRAIGGGADAPARPANPASAGAGES